MKNIVIKFNDEFDHSMIEFTLPDGRKLSAYDVGYENIYTGEQTEPSQYRYRNKYYDEFGFDISEFDGKPVVEYASFGFNKYDENILKFCKKVCFYFCKALSDSNAVINNMMFEMPERYLELLNKKGE